MTETITPAELPIPAAVWDAASSAVEDFRTKRGVAPAGKGAVALIVTAAAPHVVAAELRRLADEDAAAVDRLRRTASFYSNGLPADLQPVFTRHHQSMMRLRARADELDGGQGG